MRGGSAKEPTVVVVAFDVLADRAACAADLLVYRCHLSAFVADEAQDRALVSVAEQVAHLRRAELQRFREGWHSCSVVASQCCRLLKSEGISPG